MMHLHIFKQFFNDMRRQKLRTAMTTFGIFWGTCSIVLLFAFGQGLREQQIKSQKGLGENIAIYWPGSTMQRSIRVSAPTSKRAAIKGCMRRRWSKHEAVNW